jgi:hypothetical protein
MLCPYGEKGQVGAERKDAPLTAKGGAPGKANATAAKR